jgi:hypothetical protein
MRTLVLRRIPFVLLSLVVLLFVAACTRNVPLRHEFEFQNTPAPKVARRLLVVMDKAQAEKVIFHKPGPFADNFRYEAGPALRDSLMNLMGATFETADFATALPPEGAAYDYYLMADFKDYQIDLGRTLVSNKKFNVYIDYVFQDAARRTLFTTETDGDNINRYSGGDIATAVNPFVFVGTGKAENMLGDGWDGAVANSLNEFYFDLEAFLDENGLI